MDYLFVADYHPRAQTCRVIADSASLTFPSCMCVLVDGRGPHQVSSSVTLYLIFGQSLSLNPDLTLSTDSPVQRHSPESPSPPRH